MLNLQELEQKLDLALANETSESLSKWIEQKRLKSFLRSTISKWNKSEAVLDNQVSRTFCPEFLVESKTIDLNSNCLMAA